MLAVLHTPMVHRNLMTERNSVQEKHNVSITIIEDSAALNGSQAEQDDVETRSHISWGNLPLRPLVFHHGTACIVVNRATLITHMALINALPAYRHSDAAGYRAAYPGYCGVWYIEWPLGGKAIAKFSPHDSHHANTDVYQPFVPRRVDKCIEMLAGIIVGRNDAGPFKTAFSGRAKEDGTWVLREHKRAFGAAHGSTHLYNMMGGKVFEVDILFHHRVEDLGEMSQERCMKLEIPSRGPCQTAKLLIPEHEKRVLLLALDNLPWSSLSWSVHWGMKDVLLALGKPVMDSYRTLLAETLKDAIHNDPYTLCRKGWERKFVYGYVGDMAYSAVLAGSGNSGDVVRVATDAALLLCGDRAQECDLDSTSFWRNKPAAELAGDFGIGASRSLDPDTIIALAKFFVLEWSGMMDYQLYDDLPMEVLVG